MSANIAREKWNAKWQARSPRSYATVPSLPPLNIDDSAEFLDAIEEQISLLDGVLVLLILAIGAIRLYDAIHFVDLRVKSTSGDEPSIEWMT